MNVSLYALKRTKFLRPGSAISSPLSVYHPHLPVKLAVGLKYPLPLFLLGCLVAQ